MNINININIPPETSSERTAEAHTDGFPPDAEAHLQCLRGPLLAMLMLAFTRFDTNPSTGAVGAAELAMLERYRSPHFIFKDFNGKDLDGVEFFMKYLKTADGAELLKVMAATQEAFKKFKKFCTDEGAWGSSCEMKYAQLAKIARRDWDSLPS